MFKLQVFVTNTCWNCRESERLVEDVAALYPDGEFQILDLNDENRPDNVFAVPTYVLDGVVIFLGNPTREELLRLLDEKATAWDHRIP